jgi:hypothetical protein
MYVSIPDIGSFGISVLLLNRLQPASSLRYSQRLDDSF